MPVAAEPTLRWYQVAALDAAFNWFATQDGDPLIVLPTGSGKSLVLSAFLKQARSNYPELRAVVLATQAELVKQNVKAAATLMPRSDIGIYSAGLNQKDGSRAITVANIQSLAKKAYGLDPFDVIVVDEAHTIADADAGQYRSFIKAQRLQNPSVRVLGLTATPFKLSSGRLTDGASALFQGIAYEAPVLRLIEEGFLARPVTPRAALQLQTDDVALRGGEFVLKALNDAVDLDAITAQACDEMVARFQDRKRWLVFACTVEHARHLAKALSERDIRAGVVHGELSRDERAHRLAAFASGEIQACVNCQLLTTGFDLPIVDAIALMRPTKSPGLYAQMVGRGMRTAPGKVDCLILDFAANIALHGPVDALVIRDKKQAQDGAPPAKICPVCECYQPAGCRVCTQCGHEFPPPPVVLLPNASTKAVLSSDQEPQWFKVTEVRYHHNYAKAPKTIDTLRVEYFEGYRPVAREWVCIEHPSGKFARSKAEQWWAERSPDPCPEFVASALERTDELRVPLRIGVTPDPKNPKYTRISRFEWPGSTKHTGLPKACWSCMLWDEFSTKCEKWDATPPDDVQKTGCDEWTDEEALPF